MFVNMNFYAQTVYVHTRYFKIKLRNFNITLIFISLHNAGFLMSGRTVESIFKEKKKKKC